MPPSYENYQILGLLDALDSSSAHAAGENPAILFLVDPSGQLRVCSSASEGQESTSMENAQYFFQRGRELDRKDQSQEAIAEYTKAIELDPNYAQAYFYRSNLLALEGQPQKGIEDAQKAAAILEFRGEPGGVAAMRQHEEMIREGIEDGEW